MTAAEHPSFPAPENRNVRIWRYMGLTKFVWMLQRGAIFFARADKLGDPYEGHYTRSSVLAEEEFVKLVHNPTDGRPPTETEADNLRKQYKAHLDNVGKVKLEMFVSSWHMNEEESAAMWKLYTTLDESIVIAHLDGRPA
jgi:hypothetical protein